MAAPFIAGELPSRASLRCALPQTTLACARLLLRSCVALCCIAHCCYSYVYIAAACTSFALPFASVSGGHVAAATNQEMLTIEQSSGKRWRRRRIIGQHGM